MKIVVAGVEFYFDKFPTPDELKALKELSAPISQPSPSTALVKIDDFTKRFEALSASKDDSSFVEVPLRKIKVSKNTKFYDLSAKYLVEIQHVLRFGGWYRRNLILKRLEILGGDSQEASLVSTAINRLISAKVVTSRPSGTMMRFEYAHVRYAQKFPDFPRRLS